MSTQPLNSSELPYEFTRVLLAHDDDEVMNMYQALGRLAEVDQELGKAVYLEVLPVDDTEQCIRAAELYTRDRCDQLQENIPDGHRPNNRDRKNFYTYARQCIDENGYVVLFVKTQHFGNEEPEELADFRKECAWVETLGDYHNGLLGTALPASSV